MAATAPAFIFLILFPNAWAFSYNPKPYQYHKTIAIDLQCAMHDFYVSFVG